MRNRLVAFAVCCLTLLGSAFASPFSANYIFGDSLSDSGNLYALTSSLHTSDPSIPVVPDAPYWNGRFSNGPTFAETFSAALGLSATPSLLGGTNYAYGGARTSYHQLPALSSLTSFDAQISQYLQTHAQSDPNALYTVYIGSNDAFDIIGTAASGDSLGAFNMLQSAIASISNGLTALIASGATQFVIPTIPDLGLTPRITANASPALDALATSISMAFNDAVSGVIAQLLSADPGLTIWRPDFFALLQDVVANPGAYGLSNVTGVCYTGFVNIIPTGTVCANPDDYLFWDMIHPTAVAHGFLADTVLAAIPEPSAAALTLTALALLWLVRRRPLRGGRQNPSLRSTSGAF